MSSITDAGCAAKLHRIQYTSLVNSFIEAARPGSAEALDDEIEPYFAGNWPAPFAAQAILSDRIVDPIRRRVPWWKLISEWFGERRFQRALNETGRA